MREFTCKQCGGAFTLPEPLLPFIAPVVFCTDACHEKYVEGLKSPWRRVEDELPEVYDSYLVWVGCNQIATYRPTTGQWEGRGVGLLVTHWMPLPELPNG